jgi:hypothetical protein
MKGISDLESVRCHSSFPIPIIIVDPASYRSSSCGSIFSAALWGQVVSRPHYAKEQLSQSPKRDNDADALNPVITLVLTKMALLTPLVGHPLA